MEDTFFSEGEEIEVNGFGGKVDISSLKFGEDYTIIEYP